MKVYNSQKVTNLQYNSQKRALDPYWLELGAYNLITANKCHSVYRVYVIGHTLINSTNTYINEV